MQYKVVLIHSDEGFSISVPSLPGCFSQGETEQEALDNVREAIKDYLEVQAELKLPMEKLEVDFRDVMVA